MSSFQALRSQYASLMKRFLSSNKDFEVLTTIPPTSPAESETLYVLDSSFNPPTRAHLRIASTAILENPKPHPRLLLLLATQNADKPSKPASFEDRLAMMELFAQDLRSRLAESPAFAASGPTHVDESVPPIDIGVTRKPYFVDKAAAIESSDSYSIPLKQVHLTGYDTLIRIFDSKYYPPTHTLQPLEPFLSKHSLRVTMRPSNEWGGKEEQLSWLEALARGDREAEGGCREWAQRIQLVEGRSSSERPVSSTLAREALKSNAEDLDRLVPDQVRQFVLSENPYLENSKA